MDIRIIFRKISERLTIAFEESAQINHRGGMGTVREDAISSFLKTYLPQKYTIGRGEVITANNFTSGQLDVIIYDASSCPVLLPSDTHAVYPIESVYGAISIKSNLDSGQLKEAYNNIKQFKRMISRESFTVNNYSGFLSGVGYPMPVTGVISYASNRSLEAIRDQVKVLDAELDDITLRPDFVAVIGLGIIGPQTVLRGNFNSYNLPNTSQEIARESKSGRHTLLRIYMRILNELNKIILRPLDLVRYEKMPGLVGEHRVSGHDHFVRYHENTGMETVVSALTLIAIEDILARSVPVTMREVHLNHIGSIFPEFGSEEELDKIVYQYNPNLLPPISSSTLIRDSNNRPKFASPVFQPISIFIDGNTYAVDFSALPEGSFAINLEYTPDELFSQY